MTYIQEESKVIYQSKDGKKEEAFDALEWPRWQAGCKHSRLCVTMCLTRVSPAERDYYGYYSNVSRGRRQKEDQNGLIPCILEPEENSKEYGKNCARLIRKIYEVDSLICPKCQWKNSPVFSVRIPISCGTSFALKNSVTAISHKPDYLQLLSNTI